MHDSSSAPFLILVGGFLASGKTRLILRAARILAEQGLKTAIITNDQAEDLVDTIWASGQPESTREVAGGCFCCRFDAFASAAEALRLHSPDVIFAEPVGSCTDLVATVLRPMMHLYQREYQLAPFTVLVDPARAAMLNQEDADVAYLFRKQLEEADLVCFSKADLNIALPELPGRGNCRSLSAKTGGGVKAWLDELTSGTLLPGSRTIELDYARYARAEAKLGWLNATIQMRLSMPAAPMTIVGVLLDKLADRLTQTDTRIAHMKLLDATDSGLFKAAICRNGDEPECEGDRLAPASVSHTLTLNLRAEADPGLLKDIVEAAANSLPRTAEIVKLSAFRPAAPEPQHRLA